MTRIFGLPPGADFAALLVQGLRQRMAGQPPEAMARVLLIVNTARMRRRLTELFVAAGPGFLPRIRLITELADDPLPGLPPAVPPLRRRLELAQLIAPMLEARALLSPRETLFDLADSLADLVDEMQGEGVSPAVISGLDVADHSAHWQRTQEFMAIVARYFADPDQPDPQARQRRVVGALVERWQRQPPDHPVILAGSTGSRGTTALLMQAVAKLPNGLLVLPGFDFDVPRHVWAVMGDVLTSEDHPQFRYRHLMDLLDIEPDQIGRWLDAEAPSPGRNALVSLSLRPAPVTDQWLAEGPSLPDLMDATRDMTLVEAPSPRIEAQAIALILRGALLNGHKAALISPDRMLTRQVTAALDRWGIVPDDSAGRPLALSAPGRFLRHVVGLIGNKPGAEAVLSLLKHPLTSSSEALRGTHLRLTRELELWARRKGAAFIDGETLARWGAGVEEAGHWVSWLTQLLGEMADRSVLPLPERVQKHRNWAERLAAGPEAEGSGELWLKEAGEMAAKAFAELEAEAVHGGELGPRDYLRLIENLLNGREVREDRPVHGQLMIWGTLEARVQGADLVILGGLNDGIWPQLPPPDPWMNRAMRKAAGLLLPDRKIGLSAHDYQQAIGAPVVVLTRAVRDAEAQTVPSRWVNRLTNLMAGLPERGGKQALQDMRARGQAWLDQALTLDQPQEAISRQPRIAPAPPAEVRPRELSVTDVKTLIRDPYAIYAREVLKLRPLPALRREADVRLKGEVIHRILERYMKERDPNLAESDAVAQLLRVADAVLESEVPWATARQQWRWRIEASAQVFLASSLGAVPAVLEKGGKVPLDRVAAHLKGRPDRIDLLPDGRVQIFDYKTGTPPSGPQQKAFDKQLPLLAGMAERGAFGDLGLVDVAGAEYLVIGPKPYRKEWDLGDELPDEIWQRFETLFATYLGEDQGFAPRRAMERKGHASDYDGLSRFGEWDISDRPSTVKVGRR
ncbi:double-strand break repair protein AddB [Neogemmobacter tilapiae]|uniref:Double-strand break repair protein AddB n=1 Tax=Neogemmobacter tilapiae TaxID=875041 RepID=A0A918WHB0_9RHOB|nr:double-strand break repair protein AddB [Gemmobacter tilapiae]GHC51586.1 double-strand break repair protein AddB [Gemmobacter tilapiae]